MTLALSEKTWLVSIFVGGNESAEVMAHITRPGGVGTPLAAGVRIRFVHDHEDPYRSADTKRFYELTPPEGLSDDEADGWLAPQLHGFTTYALNATLFYVPIRGDADKFTTMCLTHPVLKQWFHLRTTTPDDLFAATGEIDPGRVPFEKWPDVSEPLRTPEDLARIKRNAAKRRRRDS